MLELKFIHAILMSFWKLFNEMQSDLGLMCLLIFYGWRNINFECDEISCDKKFYAFWFLLKSDIFDTSIFNFKY